MDGERFDTLIKRFTVSRMTRMEAVRGLLAGAGLAVTGTVLASDVIDAKNKHKGKKKKKGKKSKNNQQGTAPNNPPSPPPYSGGNNNGGKDNHDTGTTTSAPTCDKHEDCGYDAYWDDTTCGCVCNKADKGYEYCDSKDAYDYSVYGTCVSTECDGYQEYDPYSCSCQDIKCGKNEEYCSYGEYAGQCVSTECDDYEEYNADSCTCECAYGYAYCSYGKYADTCVSTECPAYSTYNPDSCECECEYGYEFCDSKKSYNYGICVSTDCGYGYYDSKNCECSQV